jgi:AcrR family transcriptional regulator
MSLASDLMEQRKQGAMDQIAHAALALFERDGFAATSVEAIAAAAGCSPRTFYRYFGTKEDVMFHDLPAVIDELGKALDGHLAQGLGPWAAVCESVVEYIGRFDATDERFTTQRMGLWLSEPALRARYMQHIDQAERVVADRLHRQRRTTPQSDNLAQLIALAAIGATRVTILTHTPTKGRGLAQHLRDALATLGDGLRDEAALGLPRPAAGYA